MKPFQILLALRWRALVAGAERTERAVAEETAIGLCYDSEPYAVLMATPANSGFDSGRAKFQRRNACAFRRPSR